MDVIDWLLNHGNVLDASVVAHVVILCLIIELFGLMSYWIRKF